MLKKEERRKNRITFFKLKLHSSFFFSILFFKPYSFPGIFYCVLVVLFFYRHHHPFCVCVLVFIFYYSQLCISCISINVRLVCTKLSLVLNFISLSIFLLLFHLQSLLPASLLPLVQLY